jgi:uncharacterized membrane protein
MGLQNAVVTRISNARVRTTHVSGMATDIGIGIGMLCDIALGREPRNETDQIASKLLLHLNIVASFLVGGLVGVLIYREFGAALLFIAAAVLYILAVPGALKARGARRRESRHTWKRLGLGHRQASWHDGGNANIREGELAGQIFANFLGLLGNRFIDCFLNFSKPPLALRTSCWMAYMSLEETLSRNLYGIASRHSRARCSSSV